MQKRSQFNNSSGGGKFKKAKNVCVCVCVCVCVQSMLRNNPEEQRSHLCCGGSLKLGIQCLLLATATTFLCFTDRR